MVGRRRHTRRVRIVFVSREHSAGEQGGGIGTYTTIVSRALAARGHEVAVVTRGPATTFVEHGVEVVRLDHEAVKVRLLTRLLAIVRISRAVLGLKPDIVQAAEWDAEAWGPARFSRTPVVTRLATPTYLAEALNRGAPEPASELLRRLERDQALRSAALVGPSRAIAERVGRDWGLDEEKITVIPNPVDADEIRAAAAPEPALELSGRYLAFFGRLEARKGVDTLAEALPEVLEGHPDVSIVFVGRDPSRDGKMEELVRRRLGRFGDRLRLVGQLPRPEALAVVARAELVVLPSRWEAFGFVAAEALALGRPVVATQGSGLAEVVEHGRSGWLVPAGDPGALRDMLFERLADPAELRDVEQPARDRAAQFRPSEIAKRLETLYADVLARRSGGAFDRSIYVHGYRRHFRPEDEAGPFHRLYHEKLGAVLERLGAVEPGRLLDAGGGPGRLSAPLAARHRVTLCDISPEMLEEASRRCPPDVVLVEADARRLPFADGAFDDVAALDLLCHLPSVEQGLRELGRVLRPGGRITFDTTNAVPWWVLAYPSYVRWRPGCLLATLRAGGVLPEWRRNVRHHRREEVRSAARGAGLEVELIGSFGPPWTPKWHLWHAVKPAL